MQRIDEQYLRAPFYGSRRMTRWLCEQGKVVNRKGVQRLTRGMGLEAVYSKPRLSQRGREARIYPYSLRNVAIIRRDQVWRTDITYVPMPLGYMYLTAGAGLVQPVCAVVGVVVPPGGTFCLRALEQALAIGVPENFNTDRGTQYTSQALTGLVKPRLIQPPKLSNQWGPPYSTPTGPLRRFAQLNSFQARPVQLKGSQPCAGGRRRKESNVFLPADRWLILRAH